ncbi:type II toxin-antitoxin system HicA family toxin [Candidatus Acetothermia bacterium]|nr:type II toxin-antitoxin system HicA family toxin [Candidatus Acetothermia bacterium]MCI2432715.1 type II toxin-antitoxin system HicA family toxin [Candidatus Acetothermia bacterium]MCI2436864.1 type II toxin-antitoxin system HicA family toxin [Candidatus Acetothermia bacterium]
MPRLPRVSGEEAVKAFMKAGWTLDRLSQRNHFVLSRPDNPHSLSVPNHKELDRGLLRSLIRKAGLTIEEFVELLRL